MIPVAKLERAALDDARRALADKYGAHGCIRASEAYGYALHVTDARHDPVGIVVDGSSLRRVRAALEKREAYAHPEVTR